MPTKGTQITLQYVAWDTQNNVGKTGDAANHTIHAVGDGVEFTPAASPAAVNATTLPGVYKITLAASETDHDVITIGGKSSTVNVSIIPITIVMGEQSGASDPYLQARIYGPVDPLDNQGRQVFRSPPNADDAGTPRVRLGPTSPRGGRTVELDPDV